MCISVYVYIPFKICVVSVFGALITPTHSTSRLTPCNGRRVYFEPNQQKLIFIHTHSHAQIETPRLVASTKAIPHTFLQRIRNNIMYSLKAFVFQYQIED